MATERVTAGGAAMADPVLTAASGAGLGAEMTVPQTSSITVNHDNVLKAARVIQDALDNEGQQILTNLPLLQVIAPGEDLISTQAAQAWNAKLVGGADSYTVRVEQYLQSLSDLVARLITSARQYGYTEEQIADAFSHSGTGG
ncbi:MAG TPA: hypothetical protein VHV49_08355 [Pseudonocardiaceae bacterium]|nr:hypothetical protein [Pseudonocardiaceae bacterium]